MTKPATTGGTSKPSGPTTGVTSKPTGPTTTGKPTNKAVLGQKAVYNYNGMKVIFINGRVSNVK